MKSFPSPAGFFLAATGSLALAPFCAADQHVTINAQADPAYTQRKFGGEKTVPETYVFMEGHYFSGTTVDHSIDKMPFRRIAELLAPDLAQAHYLPTRDVKSADLLLVVHWGTTNPRVVTSELRAITTTSVDGSQAAALKNEITATMVGSQVGMGPLMSTGDEFGAEVRFENSMEATDTIGHELTDASNAQLLGYSQELRRLSQTVVSTEKEYTLISNLNEERYFVIVKAYDAHEKNPAGRHRRVLWSLYVNIRSPGHNFTDALDLMGRSASNFFGRTSDGVQSMKARERHGTVTIPPFIILGEAGEGK